MSKLSRTSSHFWLLPVPFCVVAVAGMLAIAPVSSEPPRGEAPSIAATAAPQESGWPAPNASDDIEPGHPPTF